MTRRRTCATVMCVGEVAALKHDHSLKAPKTYRSRSSSRVELRDGIVLRRRQLNGSQFLTVDNEKLV